MAAIFALTFVSIYTAWLGFRSLGLYRQYKESGHGWERPVRTFDPALGFRALPNVQSTEYFRHGYSVDVRQDANGFRVPVKDVALPLESAAKVMALGCSFTFGSGVLAEETFAYRVADAVEGTCLNAGVEGYGLAHMVLQTPELLTTHKPGIVLVEYAPWLVERALQPVAPTAARWTIPSPYVILDDNSQYAIHPPVFETTYFELPIGNYVRGPGSIVEAISFSRRVGVPLWFNSDRHALGYAWGTWRGNYPKAAERRPELVAWAYGEIARACEENNARMIVVVLGDGGVLPEQLPADELAALNAIEGITVVNAYAALFSPLESPTSSAYEAAYGIRNGTPPVLIDRHPNVVAHRIIAQTVIDALRLEANGGLESPATPEAE